MRHGRRRWYAGALDIPAGTSGLVDVRHREEPAGTTMQSGNLRTAAFGQRSQKLTFDEPTRWHELHEEGHGLWMTDLPIEQRQTDELIGKAHGRVLVGGLGLGYAVVALAQNPRVKSITVVERSADIIALVWAATRRNVPHPDICTVVQADLFEYLRSRPAFYQWGLFDIWQSDGEHTFHETVVPLRQAAAGVVRRLVCWNEDVMRGQLYHGVMTRLMLLRLPADQHGAFGISLDALCTDTDNVYQQWAVPFWRWYREASSTLDPAQVDDVARRYVLSYGRWDLAPWEAVLPHLRAKVTV